jgi:hypothetical protein
MLMSDTIDHIATCLKWEVYPLHMNTTIFLLVVCTARFYLILILKPEKTKSMLLTIIPIKVMD